MPKSTTLKLLVHLGVVCSRHHDECVPGLRAKRLECDEIWQFCYANGKNVWSIGELVGLLDAVEKNTT